MSLWVLLDLSEVKWVRDDFWLGELVHAFTGVRNREGDLKLLHPSKNMRELLDVTYLSSCIEVFDNEDEAVASFE